MKRAVDIDEMDVSLCPLIEWPDDQGISRSQQKAAIQERIAVAQDVVDLVYGLDAMAEGQFETKH